MNQNIETQKEIINFCVFWIWEYQRRNPDYIKSYEELGGVKNSKGNITKKIARDGYSAISVADSQADAINKFIKKHKRFPKDPSITVSCKTILENELKNQNIYRVDTLSDLNAYKTSDDTVKIKWIDYSSKKKTAKIECNFSDEFEVITDELRLLYYQYNYAVTSDFLNIKINSTKEKEVKLIEEYYKLLHKRMKRGKGVFQSGKARAAGLFLYWLVEEKGLKIENAQTALVNILKKYGISTQQYDEINKCQIYFRNTKRCIRDVYLYNMNK